MPHAYYQPIACWLILYHRSLVWPQSRKCHYFIQPNRPKLLQLSEISPTPPLSQQPQLLSLKPQHWPDAIPNLYDWSSCDNSWFGIRLSYSADDAIEMIWEPPWASPLVKLCKLGVCVCVCMHVRELWGTSACVCARNHSKLCCFYTAYLRERIQKPSQSGDSHESTIVGCCCCPFVQLSIVSSTFVILAEW